jgi:hypothetical protein
MSAVILPLCRCVVEGGLRAVVTLPRIKVHCAEGGVGGNCHGGGEGEWWGGTGGQEWRAGTWAGQRAASAVGQMDGGR